MLVIRYGFIYIYIALKKTTTTTTTNKLTMTPHAWPSMALFKDRIFRSPFKPPKWAFGWGLPAVDSMKEPSLSRYVLHTAVRLQRIFRF